MKLPRLSKLALNEEDEDERPLHAMMMKHGPEQNVEVYFSQKGPGQLGDMWVLDADTHIIDLATELGIPDGWKKPVKIGNLYASMLGGDRLVFFKNKGDYTPDDDGDFGDDD